MKLKILPSIIILIMMSYSCEKNTTDPTGPTEVSYLLADIVGIWTGEASNSSNTITLELTVDSEGDVSGTGVSSQWSIDDEGNVTGGGSFGFATGSSLIIARASWSLQCDAKKTNLTGRFNVSYSTLHDMDVDLTKTASTFLSIRIKSPSDGSIVSDTVNISADPQASNVVSKVEFYINDNIIHTDISSPYSYSWDTKQYENGSYVIKVIVYDSEGQTASDEHAVVINNAKWNF